MDHSQFLPFNDYYVLSQTDILKKINRTTLNTWYEIKTISERLENIEKCMTNKTNIFELHETTLQGIDHVLQHILSNLPLKTEEDLSIFEEKLTDIQIKKKMVRVIYYNNNE